MRYTVLFLFLNTFSNSRMQMPISILFPFHFIGMQEVMSIMQYAFE